MAQPPEGHLAGFCHKAHLPVRIEIEIGYGLGRVNINSRPADILIQGWDRGHPAAFDVTVTSPLTPATLNFSTVTEGAAAPAAEERKHASNDAKCEDLGWTCISLTVESYRNGLMKSSIALLLCLLLDIQARSHASSLRSTATSTCLWRGLLLKPLWVGY